MKRFRLGLFFIALINLLSAVGKADEFIGKGCTTAFWIDEDCDGFVVGAKNPIVRATQIPIPTPPNLDPDANDNDTSVNTPASTEARYGSFTDINNFKAYLADLGYTHTINKVWFIDGTNGNNSTALVNNVNLPYLTRPTPECSQACCSGPCLEPDILPGDVVVYRAGTYPAGLSTLGSGYPRFDPLAGTQNAPILIINYPGERVIFQTSNGGFGFAKNSAYVIVQGFEFEGQYAPGLFARQVVALDQQTEHCTIKYCEVRNGDRWGIFGPLIQGRNYMTLDHMVVHHIGMEHCMYRNNGAGLQEEDEDTGWVVQDSLFYVSGGHGIHWRGGQHFTFQRNIIHSVSWFGVEMKNGPKYGTLKDNLIFNTGRGPIVMWNDGDPTTANDSGIKHMLFENNILWAKTGDNGFGNETHAAVRIDRHIAPRLYEDIRFYNNIFNPMGGVPLELYQFSLLPELHLENNIFYRGNPGPSMMVCGGTDGSHTSVNSQSVSGICPGNSVTPAYYWTFEAMQDPVLRPQFVNNIFSNPLFLNVTNDYATGRTPGNFNFFPTGNSPTIDFAEPSHASIMDLKRNPRVGPADAGAYEYSLASANNPPSVNAGVDQEISWPMNQVELSGNASDDGLPNPPGQMFTQWTKASGPGQVVFSHPTGQTTTATFSQAGNYALRLSATDGAIFRSDLVSVNVAAIPGGQSLTSGQTQFVTCANPTVPAHRTNLPVCFSLPTEKNATLEIYTRNGEKVRNLFNELRPNGLNALTWDTKNDSGESVPSGVYTAILKAEGEKAKRQKLVVIR